MNSDDELVYEAPDGLLYVTRWARRPGYDIFDLFCVQYDLREGRRAGAVWHDDKWNPYKEGDVVAPTFSIPGNAAHAMTGGRSTNLIQEMTAMLKEALCL